MTIYLHRPTISLFNFYHFFCCRYHNFMLMVATYKTCKLSLPFLAVKTNVGYSMIAEFITQHKGTESISEALGHLQWLWFRCRITANAFKKDYQKSKENIIHNMFPQSEVYLYDFNGMYCWDQYLRTAKNGLMEYREQAMALLCTVADSCSLDELIDKKLKLMSSYVWNKHHKLSDITGNLGNTMKKYSCTSEPNVIDFCDHNYCQWQL